MYFNSRPYVRGDPYEIEIESPEPKFQFTPLREGRQEEIFKQYDSFLNFNSRPYVRGDAGWVWQYHYSADFNSRPYVRGDKSLWKKSVIN